jgi:mono/diheme cytochrome c family protein
MPPLAGMGFMVCACILAGCAAPTPAPTPAAAPPAQATADPYHPVPRDTVDAETYQGWKQFNLHCSRCHGDEALGTTFGPSLVASLGPAGAVSTREKFIEVVRDGRSDKGMPSAAKIGLDPSYFEGLYRYLAGRASGQLKGGRPARSEQPASH